MTHPYQQYHMQVILIKQVKVFLQIFFVYEKASRSPYELMNYVWEPLSNKILVSFVPSTNSKLLYNQKWLKEIN